MSQTQTVPHYCTNQVQCASGTARGEDRKKCVFKKERFFQMRFCSGNNGINITQGEFTIITMASLVTGKAIANSVLLVSAMAAKSLPL